MWSGYSNPGFSFRVASDLNPLVSNSNGMHLDVANAISKKGSIAGRATLNGASHAYLLVNHLLSPPRPDTSILIEIVTGAADGEVIGRSPFGPVIVFPPRNPYDHALDLVNRALQSMQNPDQRVALEKKIAEAIRRLLQSE
jgi:hypothetical protein